MFSENMPSSIFRLAVIGLLGVTSWLAVLNIYNGVVHEPQFFVVSLVGFSLFMISKLSMLKKGHLISYGAKNMSVMAANLYRVGYWLMIVGVLGTFFGPSI